MQITPLEVGGGGERGEGEYGGNNNGQFCTFYCKLLFWLIKSTVAIEPNQENRNNTQKINLRFCASLFNLKLFRSPFGFREKFRDENGILFLFFLYFLAITEKKRDKKQQRRYKRVLILNAPSKE